MPNINSSFIKNNVTCRHCNSSKIKRSHKQLFKSSLDQNLNFNEQKLEWRQFTCSDCYEVTSVLNSSNAILSIEEFAVTPFCSFKYAISAINDQLHFYLFYKDNVKGDIIGDEIRDEHIFMFNKLFSKHNIKVANAMENYWEVSFDKKYYNFNKIEEAIDILKSILDNAGAKYDQNFVGQPEITQPFVFKDKYVYYQ